MTRAWGMAFLLVLGVLAGCGPLRTGPAITLAQDRLADVEGKGLRADAPYEVTAASRFLDLAREARGRGEYSAAVRFAEESSRLSLEARDAAARNKARKAAAEAARNAAPAPDPAAAPGKGGQP